MMCKRNLKFYICFKKIKYRILFLIILTILSLNIYMKQKINITDRHNEYPRIYCIVLTTPQYLKNKTKLVHDLWVKKCDGYKFISTIPEELINNHNKTYIKQNGLEINIGFDVLQPPNYMLESYHMLTEKTLNAFKYIYQHNPDFDFYLKADDDTYIFMENLRSFLAIKNYSLPVVYGYRYKGEGGYHSGGAGYVLTNEAMTRLGNALINNKIGFDSRQTEDIYVDRVLRTLDVHSEPTIDENGRERFHPFNIRHHYEGLLPRWMKTYPLYPVKKGIECCSEKSVSFHYINPYQMNEILMKLESKTTSPTFYDILDEMIKSKLIVPNNDTVKFMKNFDPNQNLNNLSTTNY